jgi:glutathione-regulated potassium-efflux system ancillary protein KefG
VNTVTVRLPTPDGEITQPIVSKARGLIVFAHPALERARVAPAMLKAAGALPYFPVRDLYDLYPDMTIDVLAEQVALAVSDFVVLQFPLYWYSVPAPMKEWLDLVWVSDWAYGRGGSVLRGKTLACRLFGGRRAGDAYGPEGANRFTIAELMRPWEHRRAVRYALGIAALLHPWGRGPRRCRPGG